VIFTIHSHEIAAHWHLIEPHLFEHHEWTAQEVREALESAQAQLWCIGNTSIEGIVITRLQGSVGLLWIASGRGLDEGMGMLEHIEQWFKAKGCTDVKIEGRRGWGRVLKGYDEKATIFMKRLT
jgi:hypothetical protein